MITTVIVGYDSAHTPKVLAQEVAATVATPTPTAKAIVVTHKATPTPRVITVKVSHYWPPLGGVNCANFKNGKCVSKMANGKPWEDYVDKAIACPKELKLGTKLQILGKTWTCLDRGGKITKTEDDKYWVDMLTSQTVVAYGHEVEAKILK